MPSAYAASDYDCPEQSRVLKPTKGALMLAIAGARDQSRGAVGCLLSMQSQYSMARFGMKPSSKFAAKFSSFFVPASSTWFKEWSISAARTNLFHRYPRHRCNGKSNDESY
jgi:hypothetical protein